MNDSIVSYIKNLAQSELEARINEVAVDWQSGALDLKLAKETLAREGILILKNFLNDDLILEAEKSVASMKKILVQTNGDKNYDFDNLFVQSSTAPELVGYRKLSTHPKAVANIRTGADEGMIDVFNFDKFFSGDKEQLRKPFSDPALMELFQSDSSQSEATTLNLYLNSNITKTRWFHVASYDTSYKGLCYLTDVPSLDFGPYCYIRKSHVDGPWRRINQQFSSLLPFKTEAPIFDPLDIIPCVAPKGSLILSDQSGIHRGFPQSPGHERQVLVMRYR